jgi:hypothetical protein
MQTDESIIDDMIDGGSKSGLAMRLWGEYVDSQHIDVIWKDKLVLK